MDESKPHVEESVECGECGNRYDSAKHAFCPRCGSESKEKPLRTEAYEPQRFDPKRRRAQAGGIILVSLAALGLILSVASLIAPASPDDAQYEALGATDFVRDQPGGVLVLDVQMENATAVITDLDGAQRSNHTLAGETRVDLPSAVVNVTITAGDQTWHRKAYVPMGETVRLRLDADSAQEPSWVAADQTGTMRILAGFMAFFAAFVLIAGVFAVRLRHFKLAAAGAGVSLLPGVLVLIVIPLAGLLFLLPSALALVFILQGRNHFIKADSA